jgi:protein XagA
MPARSIKRALLFLIWMTPALPAHAGAWLQPQGHGQLILNNFFYRSDHLYTNQGQRQRQPAYQKYELNPYFEYGLTQDWTVGANLSIQAVQQNISGGGSISNRNIGDSEFFARTSLWKNGGFIISAMPLIKLPSPESASNTPKIGSTKPDAGLGFSAGYGFNMNGRNHIIDVGALYRYRFGAPKDRLDISATLGYTLSERWVLLPQAFFTYRLDNPAIATFTQSSSDDYNLTKLQLSAVYKLNARTSLQAGLFGDVAGRNTGIGKGVVLSMWRQF